MIPKRLVVTDPRFDGFAQERAVAERFGAEFLICDCRDAASVVAALRDADVAFVNLVSVDAAALSGMRPGGVVIRYGIGYDNVDLEAARQLGIRVANIPDYGSDTVADHAAACMLALLRRLPTYGAAIRRHGWIAPDIVGPLPALEDVTVGLVGAGRIGLQLARRLQAFGIRILAHDPFADQAALAALNITLVTLDELQAESHGVSLHLPVTTATRHIIDRAALARLRPGAVVVNTARGPLIDEPALIEALADGRLAAAALDVFDPEPLSPTSPLRAMENVILTPHAGFYSDRSLQTLQRMAAEEAARALEGQTLRSEITSGR